ncbi:hypothetical protein ACIHCX_35770 [Streptomyces sp. NPDC052043]|uniref:hypothetical protein n=1 Tax=Streptomyces sp. NPDC052043 TaxID=3365684 RepID=UPI0037D8BEAF
MVPDRHAGYVRGEPQFPRAPGHRRTGHVEERRAELLAHRSCRDIDKAPLRGEYLGTLARARVRNDVGHIVTLVQEAVDALLKAAGSSSFMETNTLARIFQDVGVAGSHDHATPGIANDVYGKLLLGADGPLPVHV